MSFYKIIVALIVSVTISTGTVLAQGVEMKEMSLTASKVESSNPQVEVIWVIGGKDTKYHYYSDLKIPQKLLDRDGGTIRLIMQHEENPADLVNTVDIFVGVEQKEPFFGSNQRGDGQHGWSSPSVGSESGWILNDNTKHVIFNFRGNTSWAWGTDYKWGEGEALLGENIIRIVSHPHVTTRVIFLD